MAPYADNSLSESDALFAIQISALMSTNILTDALVSAINIPDDAYAERPHLESQQWSILGAF